MTCNGQIPWVGSAVPLGLMSLCQQPGVETPGYCQVSLRDEGWLVAVTNGSARRGAAQADARLEGLARPRVADCKVWPAAKTSTPQGAGEWRGNESRR